PLLYCLLSFVSTHLSPPPLFTLSLHDALPILPRSRMRSPSSAPPRPSTWTGMSRSLRSTTCGVSPIRLNALAASMPSSPPPITRSEEHTSELQSRFDIVCRLLLEKKNTNPQRA